MSRDALERDVCRHCVQRLNETNAMSYRPRRISRCQAVAAGQENTGGSGKGAGQKEETWDKG